MHKKNTSKDCDKRDNNNNSNKHILIWRIYKAQGALPLQLHLKICKESFKYFIAESVTIQSLAVYGRSTKVFDSEEGPYVLYKEAVSVCCIES